ncbi:MAG: hypothetical protein HND47_13075 [Chloroflexi bacterium]|nr:hypothetical protein [Chloroflexota bacterium]
MGGKTNPDTYERNIEMIKSSDRVVTNAPKQYIKQLGLTCGETNAKTIIQGFGKSFQPLNNLPLRTRLFGFSYIQDIQRLLEINGLSSTIQYATQLTDGEKLRTIMNHIDRNEPVLLAIGNGYIRRGIYWSLARYIAGHYITVYGYNKENQIFYIYDSMLEGDYEGEIPVGNEIRTFSQLLRDWQGPIYYKLIKMKHIYLSVSNH